MKLEGLLDLIIIFSVAPIFLWAWGHSRIYQHHLAGLKPDDSDGLVVKETELGLASILGTSQQLCVYEMQSLVLNAQLHLGGFL